MEVNDRELLELATKAAGYKKYYSHHLRRDSFVTYDETYYSEVKERQVTGEKTMDWNPLTDDGDALRLAVKLGLIVATNFAGAVNVGVNNRQLSQEEMSDDHYAATRRAIVRAAAAIAQSLPATSSASSS